MARANCNTKEQSKEMRFVNIKNVNGVDVFEWSCWTVDGYYVTQDQFNKAITPKMAKEMTKNHDFAMIQAFGS